MLKIKALNRFKLHLKISYFIRVYEKNKNKLLVLFLLGNKGIDIINFDKQFHILPNITNMLKSMPFFNIKDI